MRRMVRSLFMLCICSPLLSSCQIYGNKFDCPPGEGVPCLSVTEIESRIVESENGADLFIASETACRQGCKCKRKKSGRMIWISDSTDHLGEGCRPYGVNFYDIRGDAE